MTSISTVGMSRAEWLRMRRTGIGGSDAGKIVLTRQQYSYADPEALFLEKTGDGPLEDSPSLAARHGTWCEPFVADLYTEATGNRVHRFNRMMRSDEHPFMLADIDRKLYGRNEGLECKTIGEWAARMRVVDPETEEVHWIPRFVVGDMETSLSRKPEWYCQIQHYMAVTGWRMWHLAILVGNHDFLWFDVPRDDAWIEEMVKQEAAFWDCVERRDNIWKE